MSLYKLSFPIWQGFSVSTLYNQRCIFMTSRTKPSNPSHFHSFRDDSLFLYIQKISMQIPILAGCSK